MSDLSGKLGAAAIAMMVLAVSCERESGHVYVPGPGFTQKLTISATFTKNREVAVGEWLELLATRKTGPWLKVEKSKARQADCYWLRPPPEIEENAQSNVRWHVDPKGSAAFNVPGPLTLQRRSVRFTQPGKYRLWATSAGCGAGFRSNAIEVIVVRADLDRAETERQ